MREPVIHIGYHKTATTWLQRRLFGREDLGYRRLRLQQDGEFVTHLDDFEFDAERCRAQQEDALEACERDGLVPVFSHERLSGSPHSGGYDSRMLADRVLEVFPEARVLICIREQRAMILSCYAQYVKAGGPYSLHRYLHPRTRRRPGFRFDYFAYDRLIAYYQERLGRNSVHVSCYEQLQDEPQVWIQDVTDFCGGEAPPASATDEVVNPSIGPTALATLRWLNPFVQPESVTGWSPVAIAWLHRPATLLAKGIDHGAPRAADDLIRRRWRRRVDRDTQGRYEASNRRTAELTGLDLARWSYRL